jgi:replicative DNA helicase
MSHRDTERRNVDVLEQLQVAALYHASRGDAEVVFSICSVEDFNPGPQMEIASIIISLLADGEVNPMSVHTRASQRSAGLGKFFVERIASEHYGTPTFCANAVRDAANRRRVTASVTRAYQALTASERPVEEVVAALGDELDVEQAKLSAGLDTLTFDDLISTPDDYRPWVMPGMLRTNERLIITGPEGGGKSVLVAQLCLGAAVGLNTMSLGIDRHDPLRVLMLDVENDRLQVRNNMRKVWPYLDELSGGVKPVIEWVDVRDIDLSDAVERQKVIRLAKERMPQVMYLGSLYKLAPEGDKVDSAFNHISRTVDRIRAETGSSILLEAHTGHGMQNDRNGTMRPYGSSMWMRWPEFGVAMLPQHGKPVKIGHWRGARSDDREWPGGLRRGAILPWEPISEGEWSALYE